MKKYKENVNKIKLRKTGDVFLQEIDFLKIKKVIKECRYKSSISYKDIAQVLGCRINEKQVHFLANFLYFTLLYLPSKCPLSFSLKKITQNVLIPNRVKGHKELFEAFFTPEGRHKPFIGRVVFLQNDKYICHPISERGITKALINKEEIKISSQGMYGPLKVFYQLLKLGKSKLFIPIGKQKKETHVEKLEKLRFLYLAQKQRYEKGYIYDIGRYQRYFGSCNSVKEFRNAFSRYAIRNDFQLQRVIIALYFLEKNGRSYTVIPSTIKKRKKDMNVKSLKKAYPLSLYANIGTKTVDSVIQFTNFAGLDYYYFPPELGRPSARICLFLASQVATLDDLLVLAKTNLNEKTNLQHISRSIGFKKIVFLEKIKSQVNFLRELLIQEKDISNLVKKIDHFLELKGKGCIIDLNLPVGEKLKPCPSNIFILTTLIPDVKNFIEKIKKVLKSREEKTLYYPHFRFTCCHTYGWHRLDFDDMFATALKELAKEYILRFYAVGRPGDISHNIAPSVIRSAGQVFDHFKVLRKNSSEDYDQKEQRKN